MHARIVDGVVVELIAPFYLTEADRPAAPEPLEDGAELTPWHIEVQRAHDAFSVGEVPIEQRFTAEVVETLVEAPGDEVEVGWLYADGEFAAPPVTDH